MIFIAQAIVPLGNIVAQELQSTDHVAVVSDGTFPRVREWNLNYRINANVSTVEAGAIAIIVEKFYRSDYSANQVPTHRVSLVRGPGFNPSNRFSDSVSRYDYAAYNTEGTANYKLRRRFHAAYNASARTDDPESIRPRYVFSGQDGTVCDQTVYLLHYRHSKSGKANAPTDIPFSVPILDSHVRMMIRVIDFRDGSADPQIGEWEFHR